MASSPVVGTAIAVTGQSGVLETNRGYFNVSLSGTYGGVIILQRSFDQGGTWLNRKTYAADADAEEVFHEPEADVQYRLDYTHTTGTVTYRLSQ